MTRQLGKDDKLRYVKISSVGANRLLIESTN